MKIDWKYMLCDIKFCRRLFGGHWTYVAHPGLFPHCEHWENEYVKGTPGTVVLKREYYPQKKRVMETEAETVTKESLMDEDNLSQCECGSWAHNEHMTMVESGDSCPACRLDWLSRVIDMQEKLLRELADPALSREDVNNRLKAGYCEISGVDIESFDLLNIEIK